MAERVAVNFLQQLSGIATLTAQFCAAVRGLSNQNLDTRKTTPGLRARKVGGAAGGGKNHQFSWATVLIKDNHLAVLRSTGIDVGSLPPAPALALAWPSY